MINRVLIRIKVIQLLYSYLLVENHFMLESQPSAPTKEKRFAYHLYLDMLMLMIRIAEKIEKRGGYHPLADTRFIKKILADEKINSLQKRYQIEGFPFEQNLASFVEKIKESGLYKTFSKNSGSGKPEDDHIWEHIFNLLILPDEGLNRKFESRENFSLRGLERMKEMISETFKNFYASRDNAEDALKTLDLSMDKARELYFRLLLLPVELTQLREQEIDENRHKYLPTEEDINPNMRFVENKLAAALGSDELVKQYCETHKISWLPDQRKMMESLLQSIMDSPLYSEYMALPSTDYHTDAEFWRNVIKQIVLNDADFLESLEAESVFWNDDLDIMSTFVLKTLKRYEDGRGDKSQVLPMYKDQEDACFGRNLFADVVKNKDVYRRYIDNCINSDHWDTERLAFMDVIVTMTALSEILTFPKIPLEVSINEYVELAKSYSTSKSGAFVNGLLSSITKNLREEGKLYK